MTSENNKDLNLASNLADFFKHDQIQNKTNILINSFISNQRLFSKKCLSFGDSNQNSTKIISLKYNYITELLVNIYIQ